MSSASAFGGLNLSARFLLEEFGDCFLRIAFNDKSLLLRPRFTLSTLRLWLLCHVVLLSQRFSFGVKVVPQPGIGPGRPRIGHVVATHARLPIPPLGDYEKALNAGAVTPLKVSPVPALFGPISAALTPSSFSVLRQNSLPLTLLGLLCVLLFYRFHISLHGCRYLLSGLPSSLYSLYVTLHDSLVHFGDSFRLVQVFSCGLCITRGFLSKCSLYGRNPSVANDLAVIGFFWSYLALLLKSFQTIVNRCERLAIFGELESEIRQAIAYVRRGYGHVSILLEHQTDGIGELYHSLSGSASYKGGDFDIGRVFVFVLADCSQAIYQLFPVDDLGVNRGALLVDFGAG